jgi:hypothetical protein
MPRSKTSTKKDSAMTALVIFSNFGFLPASGAGSGKKTETINDAINSLREQQVAVFDVKEEHYAEKTTNTGSKTVGFSDCFYFELNNFISSKNLEPERVHLVGHGFNTLQSKLFPGTFATNFCSALVSEDLKFRPLQPVYIADLVKKVAGLKKTKIVVLESCHAGGIEGELKNPKEMEILKAPFNTYIENKSSAGKHELLKGTLLVRVAQELTKGETMFKTFELYGVPYPSNGLIIKSSVLNEGFRDGVDATRWSKVELAKGEPDFLTKKKRHTYRRVTVKYGKIYFGRSLAHLEEGTLDPITKEWI